MGAIPICPKIWTLRTLSKMLKPAVDKPLK